MPNTKKQEDREQLSVDDPNDADVVAYGAISADGDADRCGDGEVWDPRLGACVKSGSTRNG